MGMVVGENPKAGDICVNVCKQKHLTSIRSSGADEKLILTPPRQMGLEKAIEFIGADELVEITPKSIRLRKRILDTQTRLKTEARLKKYTAVRRAANVPLRSVAPFPLVGLDR